MISKADQDLEDRINELRLNAPRITGLHIDNLIEKETYTILPSGKVMVCELTLQNGFTVRGEAAVVSLANFNEAIGQTISYKNARDKIWELEGYLLQEKLWKEANKDWTC